MEHTIRVLNRYGDEELRWEDGDKVAEARARGQFDAFKHQGMGLFRVEPGEPAEQIRSFDPLATEIIAVKPLVGG